MPKGTLLPVIIAAFLILSAQFPEINGENILFFINAYASHSHRVGLEPLAIKLADKGHNITFFSPLKSASGVKHPNITELCTEELRQMNKKIRKDFGTSGLEYRTKGRFVIDFVKESPTVVMDSIVKVCESLVQSVEFKDLLQRSQFDLVVIDKSAFGECMFPLAYLKTRKVITFNSFATTHIFEYDLHGISAEISWIPSVLSFYEGKELSFFDRLYSEYTVLSWYLGYTCYYIPKLDAMLRKELPLDGVPPLDELVRSESLIFLNGHYSDTFPRSLPPFIIPVGGMHLQHSNGTLPQELEDFISSGENNDGFIYVSFGSVVKISTLPPKFIRIFLNAFRDMKKLKFLWKWEGEFPENVPKNVLLRKWFPQQDVLAHPKIRGFVTQGGAVSLQQAIFNAVPVIILPVNGDQDYNAKRIRSVGNGIELEFFDLTVEVLKDAIDRLLNDESYSRVSLQLSKASKERPMHPLDLAVWWTEFVLSQDDVSYLRPQTRNSPWWVTRSLDIWAFIFLIFITFAVLTLVTFYYCFKIILRKCFYSVSLIEPNKKTI